LIKEGKNSSYLRYCTDANKRSAAANKNIKQLCGSKQKFAQPKSIKLKYAIELFN
jgi:hypothetical protein